jgi:hypothetical protein
MAESRRYDNRYNTTRDRSISPPREERRTTNNAHQSRYEQHNVSRLSVHERISMNSPTNRTERLRGTFL